MKKTNQTKNAVEYTLSFKESNFKKIQILSPEKAAKYAFQFYNDDIHIYESVFIMLLNNANYCIGWAKISQGGITGTSIDTRIICKYAIESLATSVIMIHNHPAGILKASSLDLNITKDLKKCLNIFNIKLQDAIILSPDKEYLSYIDCI